MKVFEKEIENLRKAKQLKISPMLEINPFLDKDILLRLGDLADELTKLIINSRRDFQ